VEWDEAGEARSAMVDGRRTVGSGSKSDITVADPAVSQTHLEIVPRAGGAWVRDLGSRNGTFVGGKRVVSSVVPYGGSVRVGSTELQISAAVAESGATAPWPDAFFGGLIGTSAAMRELFATLARVAPLDCTVMIQGETGTGKELVARALHHCSTRAKGPFTVVDCGAFSESLFEGELFGHAKGAFTGADRMRVGAIESSADGTVFLDEIGELPMSMQPKLLRVLESSTIRRIGESQHRDLDVRFISATHRDLWSMVESGSFREDLYYRLAVVPIRVPPLRERSDDIELLLSHFLQDKAAALTPSTKIKLEGRAWTGNVRELRNFATRALVDGDVRKAARDLAEKTGERTSRSPGGRRTILPPQATAASNPPARSKSSRPPMVAPSPTASPIPEQPSFAQPLRGFRDEWTTYGERAFLLALRKRYGDNVAAAAKEAGIDRTHLYRLLRKHSL
jgi:two-component system response regulator GlrR